MCTSFYYYFLKFSSLFLHWEKSIKQHTAMEKNNTVAKGIVIRRSFGRSKQQHIELPLWANISRSAYTSAKHQGVLFPLLSKKILFSNNLKYNNFCIVFMSIYKFIWMNIQIFIFIFQHTHTEIYIFLQLCI